VSWRGWGGVKAGGTTFESLVGFDARIVNVDGEVFVIVASWRPVVGSTRVFSVNCPSTEAGGETCALDDITWPEDLEPRGRLILNDLDGECVGGVLTAVGLRNSIMIALEGPRLQCRSQYWLFEVPGGKWTALESAAHITRGEE